MESKKIIDNPKPNSKTNSDDAEKALTPTLFKSIAAIDTPPRDIASIAFAKFMAEMYEKLEKERDALKEKNEKILKENSDLKVSEATLKVKMKVSFVKDFFNIMIGVSATTFYTVSDKVIPKDISAVAFFVSLLMYFILGYCIIKKD